ncbi:MAG: bifunctional DNA primase/polymerase, partial [Stackebrandtia sp.]
GLDYATTGWPVFVLSGGKVPLANCRACRQASSSHDMESCPCLTCHGFYAATVDADRIIAMVSGHPGVLAVRTGAPSGLVVVDVDPRNGGTQTFARLLADRVLHTDTLTTRTGGGGVHLYFAHPGGWVKGGGKALGPGVDVKADGGYSVVPPSSFNGKSYMWCRGAPNAVELPPLPDAVAVRLAPTERPALSSPAPISAPAGSGFVAPVNPAGRLAGIVTALLSTPRDSGRRNEMLNWGAFTAAEMVRAGSIPAGAVVSALSEAARAIGLAPREIEATIRSGLRAGGVA